MVRVLIGDIFASEAQTLVNTVNCVGVMGKGIALGFKKRFPDMYAEYKARCDVGLVRLGEPYLYRRLPPPWILNFPTKDHWRSITRLEDIVCGLEHLVAHYQEWGITSIAVPPLGCGEGQLEWAVVGRTLYRYLSRLDIPVELHAPYGTPPIQLEIDFLTDVPELTATSSSLRHLKPEWIALVDILARIEREPYHWPVGRTTFQKIVYFATEAGLETGLEFAQASYGPHAPNLKRMITLLVNNGLIGEEPAGRMFHVRVGPTFMDAMKAFENALDEYDVLANRIADLFVRMNTAQAELAATVHFAAKTIAKAEKRRPSECDVLRYVMDWKRRRPVPKEDDVAITIRNLAILKWIDVKASKELTLPETELLEV